MTNVRYEQGASMRGPSIFWGALKPWKGIDPNDGWGFFDDFLDERLTAYHNLVIEDGDDKAEWAPVTGEECGVFRCTITGDDNEQGSIQWGNTNTAAPLVIDGGYGQMWFEGRIRLSSVTNNVPTMIFGLGEEGFCAADAIADTTFDIADKDFVGFCIRQDDGNSIDIIYQTSGSAFVTHIADVSAIVASTWIKLGMYFDGNSKLWFYVDGARYAEEVLESATGFPDGEEMSPIYSVKVSSDAALNADIDWWAGAQEAVVGVNC